MKIKLRFIFFILSLLNLFLFVNCSNFFGFEAIQSTELSSFDERSEIATLNKYFVVEFNIIVYANPLIFNSKDQFFWEHTFNENSKCTVNPMEQNFALSLKCSSPGHLLIQLSTITSNEFSLLTNEFEFDVVTKSAISDGLTESMVFPRGTNTENLFDIILPPMPENPLSLGEKLYTTQCSSCHGALSGSTKRNRTELQISSAISNVSIMRNISLSAADIKAIADALKTQ